MGFYIGSSLHTSERTEYIKRQVTQAEILQPEEFDFSKKCDQALICVVDNGPFVACAICLDKRDFKDFAREDGRAKRWFVGKKRTIYDAADDPAGLWRAEFRKID